MICPAVSRVSEIEAAIARLPVEERGRLASMIIRGLDDDMPDISPEWKETLERRSQEMSSGEVMPLTIDEFRDRLHKRA